MGLKKYMKRLVKFVIYGEPTINITSNICLLVPNERLKGKKIVITGGGKGIGFSVAEKCVKEGGRVIITGRNEDTLKRATEILGTNANYIVFDISNVNEVESFLQKAQNIFKGRIDCLVNNAGISLHEGNFKNVTQNSWDAQMNTNLKGTYFLTKKFVELYDSDTDVNVSIVTISSERGLYCDDIPYGLTKVALNSFTRGLSRRVIEKGIRVNAIAPGVTVSDMTGYDAEDNLYRPEACGKRVFLPEEVAELGVYLLSDVSKCINGEVIACDQGNYLRADW